MHLVKKQIKPYRKVYSEKSIFLSSLSLNTGPPFLLLRSNYCHQFFKYPSRDSL